ncbi:MAG TPA: rRNA maturation RNase YbeY [Candidatus Limnocylindrales bacterium]|nr:rRNA maturation RNase YbeY [Candidatus Limnocylindrales bacterium]
MPIDIVDETGRETVLAETAAAAAEAILAIVGRPDCELSIVLVGDDRMRELNHEWRGKDSPTDVLSFPQLDANAFGPSATMLGDVVISLDTLRRQAADGGWTDPEELTRLLLHGVLHLLGHDHEDDVDARVMLAEEARVVRELAARGIACASEDLA